MAGPGICVLCLADTCTSEVHPVFNPVAPYGYLLSDMCLFMAVITNPDCFFKVVGPGLVSTSPAFVSSGSALPTCPICVCCESARVMAMLVWDPGDVWLR